MIDEAIPWVEPGSYHRAALPLDIGLAPLRKSDFTMGKSDSKLHRVLDLGRGRGLLAPPRVRARGLGRTSVNCLVAKSQEQMALHTLRLLRDRPLRLALVAAAQEMIKSERGSATLRREWREAVTP